MFVIELTYTAPLTAIDAAMKPHVAWLNRHYASGTFIASGRKIPRDGGIILATCATRAELLAIVAVDPFVAGGLATARVIEFNASQRAAELAARFT